MTVEQVAQSLGVSAETLVQEVISKQTAWHTLCTAVIVLAFLAVAVCCVCLMCKGEVEIGGLIFMAAAMIFLLLLLEVHEFAAWRCAPEITARSYIAETYGGKTTWK